MKRMLMIAVGAALLLTLPGCARTTAPNPPTQVQTPSADLTEQPSVKEARPALYRAYVFEGGSPKWGYINAAGRFVIPPAYDIAEEFDAHGVAVITKAGRWGLIDTAGKAVVAPIYQSVSNPAPGGERVFHQEKASVAVDAKGAVLFTLPDYVAGFGADGLSVRIGSVGNRQLYGYVDRTGKTVIEPQFEYASDFADGKALVTLGKGQYALIDPTGRRLAEYNFPQVRQPSDNMLAFQDANKRYGYLALTGEVALPAVYSDAGPFKDGFAVVNVSPEFSNKQVGLIDRQGKFVIPATYNAIEPLGAGLYAVARNSERYVPVNYLPKAIFNARGQQLTDFRYFDVRKVEQDLISVADETATYFLDKTGAKAKGLPTVPGSGNLKLAGDLVEADVDQTLSYLTREGKLLWQADRTVALPGGISVKALKQRPDRLTLIFYPEVTGMADAKAQAEINARLKKEFTVSGRMAPGEDSLTVNFGAERLGNLLIIHRSGYSYPLGAAHGMPMSDYFHFDLATGAQYQLADLFKPGAKYQERIRTWVWKEIAKKPGEYLNQKPEIKANHSFTVKPDALVIYFYPYEVAAYAQGFQLFPIPYGELQDLINTEGPFYRALKGS